VSEHIPPHTENTTGVAVMSDQAARLMRLATYASVSVACVLIAAKFMAWMSTESVSLLSTLIDSLLDAAASLINLIAVRHALEPADREHRFGHGKAESLAGLAQSAFITGSAAFLFIEAGERLFNPRDIHNTELGYIVMALSIVLTLCLVMFQRYVISKTNSVAIMADSMHYRMDILVNIGVVISLALVSFLGWQWIDPVIAVLIAGYIVYGAWSIAKESMHVLMDHELPDEDREKIRGIAVSHSSVHGVHDMRTRTSGLNIFIQLHLELDGEISLTEAHKIADAVEILINAEYPTADVLIHQDPTGIKEKIVTFQ
jgi:ferrous-iron efflux pump FieF